MDGILLKIKKIENTIMDIDGKNKDHYILSELNKSLDYILKNEIQKLINLKNRDNGLFKKLPNEVLEKIFSFIDIKLLSQLRLVCHLFNNIISEYINKNITYCFMLKLHGDDIYTDCL